MSYSDILVYLSSDEQNATRRDAAIELALAHDAHLTGLYVMPPLQLYPIYGAVYLPPDVIENQQRAAEAKAGEVEADFNAAVARAGCGGTWRRVDGVLDKQVARYSCYADIVVMSQIERRGLLADAPPFVDYVVLSAPSPVLLIPYIGLSQPMGKRIMLAWNGSREAARALRGALPMLQQAASVEVVAVNPSSGEGEVATADVCLHLARHGVQTVADQLVGNDIEVGDMLLSRAADRGIDLLVMGAYGHTRIREAIFGGVTQHVLTHMTVPVLMSH